MADEEFIRQLASAVVDELIARGLLSGSPPKTTCCPQHPESELPTKEAAYLLGKTYDAFRVWATRRNIGSRKTQTPSGPRRLWSTADIEAQSGLALAAEAASSVDVRSRAADKPPRADQSRCETGKPEDEC